jgi:hypothetical protein
MSCRRICRELLWQARFGELGPGSAPHLEHLTECRACRDELGFDRALVRQLRTALAERIDGAAPSPKAWEGVLARMTGPEPRPSRLRAWSTLLVARLRVGSAMAGATLAIVLALNVEIVPVRTSDASPGVVGQATAARPLSLADGFAQAAVTAPYAGTTDARLADDEGEEQVTIAVGNREPEQLPLQRPAPEAAAPAAEDQSSATVETEPSQEWRPLTVRLVAADAAVMRASSSEPSAEEAPAEEPVPQSRPLPMGEPS